MHTYRALFSVLKTDYMQKTHLLKADAFDCGLNLSFSLCDLVRVDFDSGAHCCSYNAGTDILTLGC